MRGEQVLNSKSVYSRNSLPRLGIEQTEWEREAEEKSKRAAEERRRMEEREKTRQNVEGQLVEDEEMLGEEWKRAGKEREPECQEGEEGRPAKKRRIILDTNWGLEGISEEQGTINKWLMGKNGKCQMGSTQTTIRRWPWLEIEARNLLLDLADRIVKDHQEKIEEEEQQQSLVNPEQEGLEEECVEETSQGKKRAGHTSVVGMWKKRAEKEKEELARKSRLEVADGKRAELLARIQPWNWLKRITGEIVREVVEMAVNKSIEERTRMKEERE